MRIKAKNQLPLNPPNVDHPHAKLLEGISKLLDENPIITDMVYQDICNVKEIKSSGAKGMSAEKVSKYLLFVRT